MTSEGHNVSRWRVSGEIDATVAVASDLHGTSGDIWLDRIRAEAPDLILCPGDLLECAAGHDDDVDRGIFQRVIHSLLWNFNDLLSRRKPGYVRHGEFNPEKYRRMRENALAFLTGCAQIAPTYFSPGNHDALLTHEELRAMRRTGAVFLNGAWEKHVLSGGTLLIGGLRNDTQKDFLRRFSLQKGYKLLLCHRPELYDALIRPYDVNLTVAGHAHGGQWRVLNRGVFAPGQGLLPKYVRGMYENRLAVSAGLCNTALIPRFGNPPELMILEIRREV